MPFIIYYAFATIKRWYLWTEDYLTYTWGDFFNPMGSGDPTGILRYTLALSAPEPVYVPAAQCDIPYLWIKLYD